MTLKDISNIKYRTKLPLNKNDVELVVEFLKKERGSSVDIMMDEEENVK